MRNHYFSTIIFNGASTSGFESILIIARFCVNLPIFMKMFDMENLHKMLNYAFLTIKAQYARKFDAAVCFSLYRLLK